MAEANAGLILRSGRPEDQRLEIEICKNLFLCNRQETQFYLLMMPGNKVLQAKALSSSLGVSRLSFASPERMDALLNLTPGSVSVLGLMNDVEGKVRFLMDEDAAKPAYFGCHPCVNTSCLRYATSPPSSGCRQKSIMKEKCKKKA